MNNTAHIRLPHFADNRWYSADATQLTTEITGYLNSSTSSPNSNQVIGLVAPHAGHFFSGHVAGTAFSQLEGNDFNTVILIGPDHRGAAPGYMSTAKATVWRTPLGDIPVAMNVLDAMQSQLNLIRLPHDEEHALEIELPFLQVALPQFSLVPLIMGRQSLQACQQLSQALIKALEATKITNPILIASSDFSHFFDDTIARQLDEETIQFILQMDAEGLIKHTKDGQRKGQPLACGAGPIAVVMLMAQALNPNTQAHLLKYATSADVQPAAHERVVGYAAMAFTHEKP